MSSGYGRSLSPPVSSGDGRGLSSGPQLTGDVLTSKPGLISRYRLGLLSLVRQPPSANVQQNPRVHPKSVIILPHVCLVFIKIHRKRALFINTRVHL